jgi:WhiB family transcriptional regulator, redox-sensing transcriptional regulator
VDWNWQDHAACRGVSLNLFFRADGERQKEFEARESRVKQQFCAFCPVRADCLNYALTNEKEGLWGGATQDERPLIRRRQLRHERRELAS